LIATIDHMPNAALSKTPGDIGFEAHGFDLEGLESLYVREIERAKTVLPR